MRYISTKQLQAMNRIMIKILTQVKLTKEEEQFFDEMIGNTPAGRLTRILDAQEEA